MPALTFVVPGSLDTLTGGYIYDRRIVEGLRARGWNVEVREVAARFPFPDQDTREQFAAALAAIPSDTTVVVDGLAFGASPGEAAWEARRLRLVALMHLPLALETGLRRDEVAALEASERQALGHARLAIGTSEATANRLQDMGVPSDRVAVVEPGTDRAPLASGSMNGRVHLVSVGSVVPRKAHDVLIDALAMIPAAGWTLTCVGSLERDPDMVARLRAKIRAARLEDRVRLTGEARERVLSRFYDAADVFVLPAFHEGYGMAVAEALARGLPVIGTPTGGVTRLIGDVAGLLVPTGNREALARALSRVMTETGLLARLAAGARLVRDRLPTWDDASERMVAALTRAMVDG